MDAFEKTVRTVQFLSVDAVEKANSGHPGTPMALAGIAVEIFSRHLRFDPRDPEWPNRDRFVLSCGHASMLLYSLLHLAGYDLSLDELIAFRQWGSKTPGHPELGHTPGVETTTGPLGQGLGNAVGLALASKMMAARVNRPGSTVVDYRVFVLASDGDIMEGVASEASSLAGHLGLGNLVVVYDDNQITIDGTTDLSLSEDVARRYEAYGWSVCHVDGHDPAAVRVALDAAVADETRPSLVVARTHIAIGAPTKQDTPDAHGAPLGAAEVEGTKKNAAWPLEAFHVPAGARELFAAAVEKNRALREEWRRALAALDADRRAVWDAHLGCPVPGDLYAQLVAAAPTKKDATRGHASAVEQRAAALVPSLVGGSADLAGSCKTTIKGGGDVKRGEFGGRNLHYGIREHAMGAVSNGLAISGFFVPFGSTFLVFSDYMRPSVRLAALMQQRAVFVFTHDSIFLGEDGPTHQPVEHVWALRLIPNLDVVRPADAIECAAAWAHALTRTSGPTALALSRQNVPVLERPAGFDPNVILDGGYVLSDVASPAVTLIASGSEVGLALGAKSILDARGTPARVVSMPCLEAFLRLPAERQEAVLGRAPRVSMEAGRTLPWRGIVGSGGLTLGIDRFGASAPAERLATELGFTPESVAQRVLTAL